MANPFGELLLDVANQAARAASASESTLRRVEQVSRDMLELSQRVTTLETDKKWTGEERRKAENQDGTRDYTLQKLQEEVRLLTRDIGTVSRAANAAVNDIKAVKSALLRRDDKLDSRRWDVWKIILSTVIPMICGAFGTAIAFYFSKGGSP